MIRKFSMFNIILISVLVFNFIGFASSIKEFEILTDVNRILPGDKGIGLTVLADTDIVEFNIKVISILKNAFPKQDLILVELLDDYYKESGIIAGMSGSPIYIKKNNEFYLIGALAYGWSFAKKPYAGITPIKNILSVTQYDNKINIHNKEHKSSKADLREIKTPIMLSGVTQNILNKYKSKFEKFNMIPTVSGHPNFNSNNGKVKIDKTVVRPGGVIGVQLMRGDIDFTAIGTITHVDGENLFAFGHPFFGTGASDFPMTSGKIKLVLPSQTISFKLGEATDIIGTLKQDRLSCIYGKLKVLPELIPVKIINKRMDSDKTDEFNIQTVHHLMFTPFLLSMAIDNALSISGVDNSYTVKSHLEFEIEDYGKFEFNNIYSNLGDFFGNEILSPLFDIFINPYQKVKLKYVNIEFDIFNEVNWVWLKQVTLINDEVKQGENLELKFDFENYDKDNFVKYYNIPITDDFQTGPHLVAIYPAEYYSFRKEPDSFKDYLNEIRNRYPKNVLEIDMIKKTFSPELEGFRLEDTPELYKRILFESKPTEKKRLPDMERHFLRLDKVVAGQKKIMFKVIPK